jgi:hypothetical protein
VNREDRQVQPGGSNRSPGLNVHLDQVSRGQAHDLDELLTFANLGCDDEVAKLKAEVVGGEISVARTAMCFLNNRGLVLRLG